MALPAGVVKEEDISSNPTFFERRIVLSLLQQTFADQSAERKAKDGSLLLKCPFCLFWSDQQTLIFQHTVLAHLGSECSQANGTIKCPHSGDRFWSESDYETHLQQLQKSETKFFCRHCSHKSFVHCDLIEHTLKNHFDDIGSIVPTGSRGTNLKHVAIFHDSEIIRQGLGEALSNLFKSNSTDTLQRCPFCNFTDPTGTKKPLQHHILAQHLASERTPNGNIWCPHCDSEFVSEHCFRLHFGVSHCSDGHFPCLHCKVVTNSKTLLLAHLMTGHSTLMQPEFSMENDFLGDTNNQDFDESSDEDFFNDNPQTIQETSNSKCNIIKDIPATDKQSVHSTVTADDPISATVIFFSHEFKLYGQERMTLNDLTSSLKQTLPLKSVVKRKNIFNCSVCDFFSDTTIKILEHAVVSHLACTKNKHNKIRCPYCEETCLSDAKFDNHLLDNHETPDEFICRHCTFQSSTFNELTNHTLVEHIHGWNRMWSFKIPDMDRMSCFHDCGAIRTTIKDSQDNGKTNKHCSLCSFTSDTVGSVGVKQHILRRHLAALRAQDSYIHCRHCQGQFYSEVSFRIHMAVAHNLNGLYSCPHCTYSTLSLAQIDEHRFNSHVEGLMPEILFFDSNKDNRPVSTAPLNNGALTETANAPGNASINLSTPLRERSKRIIKRKSNFGDPIEGEYLDELFDTIENRNSKRKKISERVDNSQVMENSFDTSFILKKEIADPNDDLLMSATSMNGMTEYTDIDRYSRSIVSFGLVAAFSKQVSSKSSVVSATTWKCPFCVYASSENLDLVQHCIMFHLATESTANGSIQCPHCVRSMLDENRFTDHLLQVHDASSHLMCRHCCFTTYQTEEMMTHSSEEHFVNLELLLPQVQNAISQSIVLKKSMLKGKSNIIGAAFKHADEETYHDADSIRAALRRIIQSDNFNESVRKCPFCPYEAQPSSNDNTSPAYLRRHLLFRHLAANRNAEDKIQCPHCDSEFLSDEIFRHHLRTEHTGTVRYCFLCSFTHGSHTTYCTHVMSCHSRCLYPEYTLKPNCI